MDILSENDEASDVQVPGQARRTPQHAAVAEAVAVAVADDPRLHKCALAHHGDGAHVVVAEVEVALCI